MNQISTTAFYNHISLNETTTRSTGKNKNIQAIDAPFFTSDKIGSESKNKLSRTLYEFI